MKKRAVKEGKQYARLAAYAAAVGATLASAGTAEAGIVYSGVLNIIASGNTPIAGTSFLVGVRNYPSSARVTPNSRPYNYSRKAGPIYGNTQTKIFTVGSNIAKFMVADEIIGSKPGFCSRGSLFNFGQNGAGLFNLGQFYTTGGYVGIRFGSDGAAHHYYGWMHIAQVDRTVPSFSIDGWAYETTADLAIKAGATVTVPEPTSCALALIALGAGGLAVHRRRRQERDALTDLAE